MSNWLHCNKLPYTVKYPVAVYLTADGCSDWPTGAATEQCTMATQEISGWPVACRRESGGRVGDDEKAKT